MFDLWIVLTFALMLLISYFLLISNQRRNLPPFPTKSLPIVGNLLSLEENPRELFKKWRKKHGDMFSLYLGQTLVIVINGYDAMKDAFVTHGQYFSDRPPLFIDRVTGLLNKGVALSSGENWHTQRSVSLFILRSLGLGKNVLARRIGEEVRCFLEVLEQLNGKATDIKRFTDMAVYNVMHSTISGKRLEYDDESLSKVLENIEYIASNIRNTNVLHFYPSLMKLPGDLFGGKKMAKNMKEFCNFLKHSYLDQKYSRNGETQCEANMSFVDAYQNEGARRRKQDSEGKRSLDEDNLSRTMFDLVGAGTETTSSTISWFILYLIHFPEVQKKIYEEIDSEIGTHRAPQMKDRPKLPYLNATIMEVQRIASIVPLSLFHSASETVEFRGFTIPKGACLAPNIDSVLHDPTVWGEDAMSFRPERHLDDQGKLVVRNEFIPFSIGRRLCLGEGLAKMELFLFTSSMVQKFSFEPENPKNLPTLKERFGVTATTNHYKVKVIRRH